MLIVFVCFGVQFLCSTKVYSFACFLKRSIPRASWDPGGWVVEIVQKWARYGTGLQTQGEPVPFKESLCPSGRAVTSSDLASLCPTAHSSCPPPPGCTACSAAPFPGSTWARTTFLAGHWIITTKSGLPLLVFIFPSTVAKQHAPLGSASLPGLAAQSPASRAQASAAAPTDGDAFVRPDCLSSLLSNSFSGVLFVQLF